MERMHQREEAGRAREIPEFIRSAAIVFNGITYTGANHAMAIRELERVHPNWQMSDKPVEEGFLTNTGRFVDREKAGEIAERAEQLSHLDEEERGRAARDLDSYDLRH